MTSFRYYGLHLTPILIVVLGSSLSQASGKKKPVEVKPTGKKVIGLSPMKNMQIEMPDHSMHNFGEDYQASLITKLMQKGRYILVDAHPSSETSQEGPTPIEIAREYEWPGSATPAATVRVIVEAMNFRTGSLGDSMFYGFDERFRTPFNDGSGELRNEFPLKTVSIVPSWFGDSFNEKGIVPFNSRSGLDLGDGFKIDALYAWLSVKYAIYHSELHLKLCLDTPLGKATDYRFIRVGGTGFFFDVSGAYQNYSAGISLARRDAMEQALKKALVSSVDAIERALAPLPLMAKIDAILADGTILMGTGRNSEVPAGSLYQIAKIDSPVVIQVSSSGTSGSVGRVVYGDPILAKPGALLQQVNSLPSPKPAKALSTLAAQENTLAAYESITLPTENIPAAPLGGLAPTITRLQALAKSIAEGVFLPYRIWRYFNYDQSYHTEPDTEFLDSPPDLRKDTWAKQIGFDLVAQSDESEKDSSPVVAVVDSGVDFNHPAVYDSLWINPTPFEDPQGRKDRYGWDFVSEDSRPYDDGYHGTQIASLVAAIAPMAKIMPIKIFNPWGITSSATVYAGFTYAVDHGAQIIVCGWSTGVDSQAIRMGVAYAKDHGVAVIAAAGDQGINLAKWNDVYPAVLSRTMDNQVTVAGVDEKDQLLQDHDRKSNFDPTSIQIAAPGQHLTVLEPRMGEGVESSTGLAAAIVAGVMARNLSTRGLSGTYVEWIQELLEDADPVSSLVPAVNGGRRVHVRR